MKRIGCSDTKIFQDRPSPQNFSPSTGPQPGSGDHWRVQPQPEYLEEVLCHSDPVGTGSQANPGRWRYLNETNKKNVRSQDLFLKTYLYTTTNNSYKHIVTVYYQLRTHLGTWGVLNIWMITTNPWDRNYYFFLFYRWKNWRTEKLDNTSTITGLVKAEIRIRKQKVWMRATAVFQSATPNLPSVTFSEKLE